ncbi:hypothetical protein SUNI508_09100 [Seiridium unicorne]|uniref:Uncharacterized protein n=1 Tax=Seiridium unicorne TaxID=138068 RepID=A0ABR2UQX9_9PEZI
MSDVRNDTTTLTPAPQPRNAYVELAGEVVPRGTMLFTSCLLPFFGETPSWHIYTLTMLIYSISLIVFTYLHLQSIKDNLRASLMLSVFAIFLYFPFPGISLVLVFQKIPVFLMLCSLGAVEIGRLRGPMPEPGCPEVQSQSWFSPGLGSRKPLPSAGIPEKEPDIEMSPPASEFKDVIPFSFMSGPSSHRSGSDHSSDFELSVGDGESPRPTWGYHIKSFFKTNCSTIAEADLSTPSSNRSLTL